MFCQTLISHFLVVLEKNWFYSKTSFFAALDSCENNKNMLLQISVFVEKYSRTSFLAPPDVQENSQKRLFGAHMSHIMISNDIVCFLKKQQNMVSSFVTGPFWMCRPNGKEIWIKIVGKHFWIFICGQKLLNKVCPHLEIQKCFPTTFIQISFPPGRNIKNCPNWYNFR